MIYLSILVFFLTIDQVSRFIQWKISDRNETIVGYSFLIIITNFLSVTLNLFSKNIFIFLFISLIVLIFINQNLKKNNNNGSYLFFFSAFIIVILPVIFSNYNFFVFRGNWWDHFNYISGVLALKYSTVETIRENGEIQQLIGWWGNISVSHRPSVVIMNSTFSLGVDIYKESYLFLAAYIGLLNVEIGKWNISKNIYYNLIFSLAISFGFWGQYVFDISAWSHLACLPIYFCIVRLILTDKGSNFQILVLLAAAFIVYQEATIYLIIVFGISFLLQKIHQKKLITLIPITVVAVSISIIDYEGAFSRIFSFLMPREVAEGLSQTGILYFGQVFFGYDFTSNFYDQISNIKNLIMKDGIIEVFYFLTKENLSYILLPLNIFPILIGNYFIIEKFSFSILIETLVSFLVTITFAIYYFKKWNDPENKLILNIFVVFSVLFLYFLMNKQYWEMFKSGSYIFPIITVLIVKKISEETIISAKLILSFFLVSNLGFIVERGVLSWNSNGIGHSYPFPSVLRYEHKMNADYQYDILANNCRFVFIDESNFNKKHFLLNLSQIHGPKKIINDLEKYVKAETCIYRFKKSNEKEFVEIISSEA